MEAATLMQLAAALLIYAGLAGAAGVALAAAGAHGNDLATLTPPAYFLIMHAAAASRSSPWRCAPPSGVGSCWRRSSCSSASRCSRATSPPARYGACGCFPMAAPIGGSTMILGWLVLSAAGIWELLAAARIGGA